jgi:hypothetical protein
MAVEVIMAVEVMMAVEVIMASKAPYGHSIYQSTICSTQG